MKSYILFLLVFISFSGFSQVDREWWLSAGVKYKVNSKVDLAGELSSRMEGTVLNTFYPELTMKYELLKWLKVSGDYRLLWDKNKWSNYDFSQRLSLNAQLKERVNRFELSFRVRLQNTIEQNRIGDNAFSDFKPGWRFKPEVLYDINNSIFSPAVSFEWFNVGDVQSGYYLNKYRISAGVDFELDGPYDCSIKYLFSQSAINYKRKEHILSLSFTRKYQK